MRLLLHNEVVLGELYENLHAVLNHQVVHPVRIPIRAPHDATELRTSLKEVALLRREDVGEETGVVDGVNRHPVLLRLHPLI